ncbi:hypothetical protein R6Z07_001119 [Ovis aries]
MPSASQGTLQLLSLPFQSDALAQQLHSDRYASGARHKRNVIQGSAPPRRRAATSSRAAPHSRQHHAPAGDTLERTPPGRATAGLRPSGLLFPAAARERHYHRGAMQGTQLAKARLHRALGEATSTTIGGPGPTRLHASQRCAERTEGSSRAVRAHSGSHWGSARGRAAGRQIRLWSGKAVGSPRRPSLRRGDRAPADDKGLRLERCTGRGGRRELGRAPPSAAPWRLAQRRREETKGPWGPGGRTESDRGHQKGCVASPSGNRTPVSRVTGGDTHHYTNEDGGDRPAARPPSGSRAACPRLPLPSTGRRPPRVPTQPRTKPTASVTAAARHPDRDPDPRGAGPSPARRLLPPTRAFRREKGAREGKRGCDDTPRRAPPPAAPKHAATRRVASPPPFAGAPTSARGTAYSPSQPCFHGRPRQLSRQAGTPSSAPAPPARLRSPATARRPSPRLARQGAAACPRPLSAVRSWPGRNLPAARPGRVPSSLPAGQRTPAFLARVRPGKGAPLGRERKPCVPVQPTPRRPARAPDLGATAPVPVGSRCPGRSQARPGALPASQPGSPRARSRAAKGPLLTTTTPSEPDPGSAAPKGPSSPPAVFGRGARAPPTAVPGLAPGRPPLPVQRSSLSPLSSAGARSPRRSEGLLGDPTALPDHSNPLVVERGGREAAPGIPVRALASWVLEAACPALPAGGEGGEALAGRGGERRAGGPQGRGGAALGRWGRWIPGDRVALARLGRRVAAGGAGGCGAEPPADGASGQGCGGGGESMLGRARGRRLAAAWAVERWWYSAYACSALRQRPPGPCPSSPSTIQATSAVPRGKGFGRSGNLAPLPPRRA